jgi:amino acid transporter
LPLPRVLYAIAADGLIFRCIAWIHPRLQTPVIATILGGFMSGIKTKEKKNFYLNNFFFFYSNNGIII